MSADPSTLWSVNLKSRNRNCYFKLAVSDEIDTVRERVQEELTGISLECVRELHIASNPYQSTWTWARPSNTCSCVPTNPQSDPTSDNLESADASLPSSIVGSDAHLLLNALCKGLANQLRPGTVNVTFDFNVSDVEHADELLRELQCLAPLKSFSCRYKIFPKPECHSCARKSLPDFGVEKGMITLEKTVQEFARLLTKVRSKRSPAFPFMRLPLELQRMVISHAVADPNPIPIAEMHNRRHFTGSHLSQRRCCGACSGPLPGTNRDACRCRRVGTFSTRCLCVSLSDGIFADTGLFAKEAEELFWTSNIFLLRGPLGCHSFPHHLHEIMEMCITTTVEVHSVALNHHTNEQASIPFQLLSIPVSQLAQIRRLVIETDWPAEGFGNPSHWHVQQYFHQHNEYVRHGSWEFPLRYLAKYGRMDLEVNIRITRLPHNPADSFRGRFNIVSEEEGWYRERAKQEQRKFIACVQELTLKVTASMEQADRARVTLIG